LTLSAYHEFGGVKGALTRKAEETYAALPSDEHRKLARALFVRLIDPGVTEQDTTRRRAALSEFSLPEASQTRLLQEVADVCIAARLLTTNEIVGTKTIEVSHEALIRAWPRLAGWLREAREDILLQQTISKDAVEWEQRNKPGDRLYRGSQLKEAQAWARRNTPSGNETAFLHASATSRVRFLVSVIAVLLIVVSSMGGASWILTHQPPKAPDPTRVSNTQDNNNPGSLRYAVDEAPPGSTIRFDASLRGTITLSSGDLDIARNLTILGPGADILSIRGGKSGHIIHVLSGTTVTISDLTFKDSDTLDGFIVNEGTLTLSNSTISGNTGGGIYNQNGKLTLSDSVVSGNTAYRLEGGGITSSGGTLMLSDSTVSGNTQTGSGGGGIYNFGGTLILSNSTVSSNMATGSSSALSSGNTVISGNGGGIANSDGTLILSNSTVSGNTATGSGSAFSSAHTVISGDGGGIFNEGIFSTLILSNSTVSNNTVVVANRNISGHSVISGDGGGIFILSEVESDSAPNAHVDLTYSTLYGNTAHGGGDIAIEDFAYSQGVFQPSKHGIQVKIRKSIVAGDPAHPGPDIVGMLTSYGYNLFQDNSGATFDPATSLQHGTDKTLSVNDLKIDPVLRDNGGSTKPHTLTHALLPGSPAIDQIPLDACLIKVTIPLSPLEGPRPPIIITISTDQRGMQRPDKNESSCDIGAYEFVDSPT
jgi:hypothetical protein